MKNFIRQLIALLLTVLSPATAVMGQTVRKGNLVTSPFVFTPGNFFGQVPLSYVNSGLTTANGFCSPPGGVYDNTVTITATSVYVHNVSYPATFAGLSLAKTEQNAANQHWLLQIDVGVNIHGSTHDANGALQSWPTGTTTTKCLTVQSSNHSAEGVMPCSQFWPIVRDANCAYAATHFWKFTLDSAGGGGGNLGMYFPHGSGATGPSNYILLEDVEIAPAPGSAQSANGSAESVQLVMEGDHIGVAYFWVHGWNAGDAGQPGAGSGNAAVDASTGVCLAWNRSGQATTSGSTVTWSDTANSVTGNKDQFGMDFSDGANSAGYPQVTAGGANHLTINGVNYTITNHNPADTTAGVTGMVGSTVLTVSPSVGTNVTPVNFSMQNPRTGYGTGCGDDSRGIQPNCTHCFLGFGQVNKIHWWGSESHAISFGFSISPTPGGTNGPVKLFYLYVEGGSCGFFVGGGDLDSRGGPVQDVEAGNFISSRDLDWRFMTGGASGSPHPPFGCGPLDGVAKHSTCPFQWAVKNNIELKEGNRVVLYSFIVENSWPDGQSGSLITITPRTTSGGGTRGIFDPVTGLPLNGIQNIRIQDFWCRNAPQCFGTSARSLSDPGNGGGLSLPVSNVDLINGVISNTSDKNQWGTSDDLGNWSTNGQAYIATVSRTAGVAHAVATPIKNTNYAYSATHGGSPFKNVGFIDNAFSVSTISSVDAGGGNSTVTIKFNGARKDPPIGGQVTVANQAGWNGTFTISTVQESGSSTACTQDNLGNTVDASIATQPQNCVRLTGPSAGTFGDTIVYTDSVNHQGTTSLCTSLSTCNTNAPDIQMVVDTYAFKMTDINAGDGVYTHDCTDSSFNAGGLVFSPALPPTSPLGLDVYFSNPGGDVSGVTCTLENSAGWPANMSIQNITVLSDTSTAINSNGQDAQHHNNWFLHNVFAETGANADFTCRRANEGTVSTAAAKCWDLSTLQFFDSVLQGRSSALWPVVNPVPGALANFFPTKVDCANTTADLTCLGYTGFMDTVHFPSHVFPTTLCVYNGNPSDCPLMAAPWANNLTLPMLVPVATSSYQTEGASISAITFAFTVKRYQCPVGANCGSGTKPD